MTDLVTVIVPVYNGEKYLIDCLDSLTNQTYKNIEIIVLDDGSKDNSSKILKDYSKEHDIIIVNKKNSGVSDTRNIGISKATGKYIMFLDCDDWLNKDAIKQLVKTIKIKKVDVIRFNVITYDKNGKKKYDSFYDLKNIKLEDNDKYKLFDYIFSAKNNIPCYTPTLFMKKEVIPNFNKNLKYMEDMVFYIDLLNNIKSIYFLDEHYYNYRYNNSSVTKNNKQLNNVFEIIKTIEYLKSKVNKEYDIILNNLMFSLTLGKIDMFLLNKDQNFLEKRKQLKKVFINSKYSNMLKKVNFSKLSLNKRISYFLIKCKMFIILYIYELFKIKITKR